MSEETAVEPVLEDAQELPNPTPDEITKSFQAFANKCFELGRALYNKQKADKDHEAFAKSVLFDIDNLARKHDKLAARKSKEDKQVTG